MMNTFYTHSSWGMGPWWFTGIGVSLMAVFAVLLLVVVALKGYSLWHAAKRDEKGWFVALLILNTFGILELVYIIFILKKWHHTNKTNGGEHTHHQS